MQKHFNLNNCSNNSAIGCFLKVDVDYPDKFHNLYHNNFLVDEKMKVGEEILSEYLIHIIEDNNFLLVKTKMLSLI